MKILCIVVVLVLSIPVVSTAQVLCSDLFASGTANVFKWKYRNAATNKEAVRVGRLEDNNGLVTGIFGPWVISGSYVGNKFQFNGTSKEDGAGIKGQGTCNLTYIIGDFGFNNGSATYYMTFEK